MSDGVLIPTSDCDWGILLGSSCNNAISSYIPSVGIIVRRLSDHVVFRSLIVDAKVLLLVLEELDSIEAVRVHDANSTGRDSNPSGLRV